MSNELRPIILQEPSLVEAIEYPMNTVHSDAGTAYRLVVSPDSLALDYDRIAINFSIFREIVTNIARHAHASFL